MIKKMAWEIFKNTGDINTYLEFKQIQQIEKGFEEKTQVSNIINQEYKEIYDKESNINKKDFT